MFEQGNTDNLKLMDHSNVTGNIGPFLNYVTQGGSHCDGKAGGGGAGGGG